MEKWKKLKRANLANSVNIQKQPPEMLYKISFSKTGWNGVRCNYVPYLFVSFWYHYICMLSRSSRTDVFLKKVFLKISQNSQENTCTEVSFLSAVCNFINEQTLTQCFLKSLVIFTSIVDVRLGYKYTAVLPPDLKPS